MGMSEREAQGPEREAGSKPSPSSRMARARRETPRLRARAVTRPQVSGSSRGSRRCRGRGRPNSPRRSASRDRGISRAAARASASRSSRPSASRLRQYRERGFRRSVRSSSRWLTSCISVKFRRPGLAQGAKREVSSRMVCPSRKHQRRFPASSQIGTPTGAGAVSPRRLPSRLRRRRRILRPSSSRASFSGSTRPAGRSGRVRYAR